MHDADRFGSIASSCRLPCRWHNSHIIVMEEVVISGPGYDAASTNVPGFTREQLQSYIDGTNTSPAPDGAQSKANSWQRVTKVVRTAHTRISLHLPCECGSIRSHLSRLFAPNSSKEKGER